MPRHFQNGNYTFGFFYYMPRKKETLTLSVPPGTKQQLEALAAKLGINWGSSPSASGLVVAIATQALEIGSAYQLDASQQQALDQATKALVDAGYVDEAQIVLALLLDRSTLEAPLRQALMQKVGQPSEAWRIRVDQLRQEKRPFLLSYLDGQKQLLSFTVHYAEVVFYEKRFFVQAWCEEVSTPKESDLYLPELKHNRCFRLDRVQSIAPFNGTWRAHIDFVKVQLHFSRGLVTAYESKPEDIEDTITGQVRRVVRRVANPFWLMREVRRYGKDCVVVTPDVLRHYYRQELEEELQQYQ
jgi:predicted DNA-binding transcriptional regulator YafY